MPTPWFSEGIAGMRSRAPMISGRPRTVATPSRRARRGLARRGRCPDDRAGPRRPIPHSPAPAPRPRSARGMIRPTEPDDPPALVEIARGTAVFKPAELVALREVLDDYHAGEASRGHRAATSEI